MRFFVLLFITNCLTINFSFSQIVNIENLRLNSKKEGWTTEVDMNFSLIKNVAMITQLGNRNKIGYRKEEHGVLAMADFGLVKVNDNAFVNSGFGHLRYTYNLRHHPKIYYEGFIQSQYNKVQLVKSRNLLGAGARFELIKLDSFALNVGAFVMGEYELQTDAIINKTVRYSCFLSFDYQFNKSTGINTITYYQPDFLDPSDFRISSETSLRVKVSKTVNLKIVYNLYFDTNPPGTIPTTMYYLSNAISLRF